MQPRILIIEDDPEVAEALEETLRFEGYEAALARDGSEGLASLEGGAAPDLILLDRAMPGMDGVEFRQRQLAIPRLASIPTVVLSGSALDEPMVATRPAAWLRKPMELEDLFQVLRRYCPDGRAPNAHLAHFFSAEEGLIGRVATFLAQSLETGGTALAIATEPHRMGIKARLAERGLDVLRLERQERALFLDAARTLDELQLGSPGDDGRFGALVNGALDRLTVARPGHGIRAYGEMVDLLWRAGEAASALRLESLWTDLVAKRRISLLCAYARAHGGSDPSTHEDLRHHHSAVV